MAINRQKIRIGDLLIQNDVITEDQLINALASQKQSGQNLLRVMIESCLMD
jgi:MSHA biogenesis protein MshE